MENIKAFIIKEKEFREIDKIYNFNVNGCTVKAVGYRKHLNFYFSCTNDEVYLILLLDGGGMLKLSDMTPFVTE